MTFAVAKRPRRAAARSAGVSFRLFFRAAKHSTLLHDGGPHVGSGMHRDFLPLFMETREVCESVSRGAVRQRERLRKDEGRETGGGRRGRILVRFASQAAPA